MPNDAELRRTGHELHARLHRDGDVLAEPREPPDRHLPVASRGDADDDRTATCFPDRAQRPRRAAHRRRGWRSSGEVPRGRAGRARSCRGLAAARPQERQRARAAAGHRHPGHAAARARLPRRAEGQVAPLQAGRRRRLERRRPAAHRARLRLRRLGPVRGRRRRQGDVLRRRAAGHHAGAAGTRTTRARWRPGSRGRTCPSPSASSGASSTRTTCSATRPPIERGGYTPRGVRRPARAAAADARRGPARQADRPGADEARADVVPRRAATGAREQQRYVDFYAHLHRVVDAKIGRLLAALGDPGDPASLRVAHGGRADRPTTASWASRTAACGRRCSTPTRSRSACRWSSRARRCSPRRARATRSSRSSTSCRRSSAWPARPSRPPALRRPRPRPGAAGRARRRPRRGALHLRRPPGRRPRSRRRPGQPNRIRCVRDRRWKYAVYLDPDGRVAPEYELYDLESDPDEALNLVDKRTGIGRTAQARARARCACTACSSSCAPPAGRRRRRCRRRPGARRSASLGPCPPCRSPCRSPSRAGPGRRSGRDRWSR